MIMWYLIGALVLIWAIYEVYAIRVHGWPLPFPRKWVRSCGS